MPLRLEIQDSARRDLVRISTYIAQRNKDWTVAERFAERLVDRCQKLTKAPGAGAPTSFAAEIRKVTEGAYKIYYRVEKTQVLIMRIWDGRRGSEPRL